MSSVPQPASRGVTRCRNTERQDHSISQQKLPRSRPMIRYPVRIQAELPTSVGRNRATTCSETVGADVLDLISNRTVQTP